MDHQDASSSDRLIIATAEDAIITKNAAVEAGYYQDRFVKVFYLAHQRIQPQRPPRPVQVIIKRGTFARVACVSKVIRSFLSLVKMHENTTAQVVILGAGKDTSFFRFVDDGLGGASLKETAVRWVEVDHAAVIKEKVDIIHAAGESTFGVTAVVKECGADSQLFELRPVDSTLSSSSCCYYVPYDLRNDMDKLCQKLFETGLEKDMPTLFVSECVLMYINDSVTRNLLASLSKAFPKSCICLYEPILGHDAFGQMMQDNLTRAGVAKLDSSLVKTRSLAEQIKKLSSSGGFVRAVGCDMYAAYETILTAEERRNANQCEFLDELEEFMLIMRHYCMVVASTADSTVGHELCQTSQGSPLGFSKERCQESNHT